MIGAGSGELRCGNCDEVLPASARFCFSCGAPVVAVAGVEVRKTVTLLFCDVSGSTALGEGLDPEALRDVMSRYFAAARLAVERHGGTVEKFVGDAVMSVFGIPEVREDDALRAVRAAADLRDSLAVLSEELMDSLGVRLSVRTGVNTGPVVAGSARAGGSFATGDAVNTAARLEQSAAPGEILISASTWSLVRDAVEAEPIPPLMVKGKVDPLPAYRLVRVLETGLGRSRHFEAALVGRSRESRALADALAGTIENGHGQLVTVLGAAGMGKTRLVEQFLAGIGSGALALTGRCLSYGRGITFWPIVQLLRQAAGLHGGETAATARAALIAVLDALPDADTVANLLLPLLGHGGEPGDIDETFWAIGKVFARLAAQRPLVVVVDDVHWAEPTLLDLLEQLHDETRAMPVLLVCQARPEFLDQRPDWGTGAPSATTVLLEPLTESQTAALLEGLVGPGLPEPVVHAVHSWAEGNPFFAEEVATNFVEDGVLCRRAGGWEIVGDLTTVSVPPTVSALLAARLDRLPRQERALLERISIIGLEVTTDDAQRLAAEDVDVPALLTSLSRRDLLRHIGGPRGISWMFRHVLLREAAYSALPKSTRAELHERFADRLAESSTATGGEVHAFIGYHLERAVAYRRELSPNVDSAASLASRAADVLATAAAHARDIDDRAAASGFLERAVNLIPSHKEQRRDLMARVAQVQEDRGYFAQALQTLQQVVELMDATAPELERAVIAAVLLKVRTEGSEELDPAELRVASETAARLAREEHDHLRLAQALYCNVSAVQMSGLWTEAERVLHELERIGTPADRRRARGYLLVAYHYGTRHVDDGLAHLARIRNHSGQSAGQLEMIQRFEAALLAVSGRTEEALALAGEAEQTAAASGPFAAGINAQCTAEIYVARGDLPQAIRALEAGIAAFREGGGLAYASTLLAWQAALLLEHGGQDGDARRLVDEAAAVTSPFDVVSLALIRACRALLASRGGAFETAAAEAAAALATTDATDSLLNRADIRRWLSEIPQRRGDLTGQRRLLLEARDLYRAKGHRPLTAATDRLLSEITA